MASTNPTSSFLRKLVSATPPEVQTREVEFTDPDTKETSIVVLSAHDDAEAVVRNMMQDSDKQNALALSITATLKLKGVNVTIDPEFMPYILMVHECLTAPEGEEKLDIADVALIAKRYGSVFLKLLAKAGELSKVEDLVDQFMSAQSGNSSAASVRKPSQSGSGASRRPAKSRRH